MAVCQLACIFKGLQNVILLHLYCFVRTCANHSALLRKFTYELFSYRAMIAAWSGCRSAANSEDIAMNTIYLEPSKVPAHLRGSYTGKMFKVNVCTSMTVPFDAGLWCEGSRDLYTAVELDTGREVVLPGQNASPWSDGRSDKMITLLPGYAVVRHSIFCGKDTGLTFYVHPDNAAKLLPAPVELTAFEQLVLRATASFKASYQGMDRYQMMMRECRYSCESDNLRFPSRAEWDAAKQSLIARGMLNKAGAITPAGRNAAR